VFLRSRSNLPGYKTGQNVGSTASFSEFLKFLIDLENSDVKAVLYIDWDKLEKRGRRTRVAPRKARQLSFLEEG